MIKDTRATDGDTKATNGDTRIADSLHTNLQNTDTLSPNNG